MMRMYTVPTEFSAVAVGQKRLEAAERHADAAVTLRFTLMTSVFVLPGPCEAANEVTPASY